MRSDKKKHKRSINLFFTKFDFIVAKKPSKNFCYKLINKKTIT